jgi:hypothetical protein
LKKGNKSEANERTEKARLACPLYSKWQTREGMAQVDGSAQLKVIEEGEVKFPGQLNLGNFSFP